MNENATQSIQPDQGPANARNRLTSGITYIFSFSGKLASSQSLRYAVTALLPALILLRYPTDPSDYDLWWQMALGKYYLAHHTLVVDHSIFSWTPADPGWIYNTCLGSIIYYVAYNLMGGFGLWMVQWLVFLGIFISFYLFLRLISQKLDVTSITLIAAIGVAMYITCVFYKPELFSALLFSWMVFIFFCVKLTHRSFLFYLYPFIFVFWVNLHGAFVFGFFFLTLAFFGELLNRFFFPNDSFTTQDLAHMGAACALSLLATLLNPYGIDYLMGIYSTATSDLYMNTSRVNIIAYMSLWPFLKSSKLFLTNFGQTVWIMSLMMFFIGWLFLYDLIKKRSCDFSLLIVNVGLFLYGMGTGRASYFSLIASFFSFFYLLNRLKLRDITTRATLLSLFVFLFFFVNIANINFRLSTDNKWFGTGLYTFVPTEEVAFLKKYKLAGPLFNDYLIGGYLIWDLYPDYKVFIDPRFGPYWKQVAPDYMAFTGHTTNKEAVHHFTEKYHFKIAMIHYHNAPMIFSFLEPGSDWRLLYFGQHAAILIHKSLLSSLSPEMLAIDADPLRFREVRNPQVLINLFNFYINHGPKFGRAIYDIYKKNVSDYYIYKPAHLQAMDLKIQQKALALQAPSQKS